MSKRSTWTVIALLAAAAMFFGTLAGACSSSKESKEADKAPSESEMKKEEKEMKKEAKKGEKEMKEEAGMAEGGDAGMAEGGDAGMAGGGGGGGGMEADAGTGGM